MRRWIVFGFGALILGAAAWYFGKPMKVQIPSPTQAAVEVAQAETAKEPAPKVIEVIDLARAYEPVPEPEETVGGVDPATFIEASEAPARIPPAVSDDAHVFRDLYAAIRRTPLGAALFGPGGPSPQRLDVMPREVK
jgi:hypothetical protein